MNPREFFINPADYGLPTRDELVAYRIWDNHFHGFASKSPIEQYEQNNFFVERMGIERSISQEIGGTLEAPFDPYPFDAEILKISNNFEYLLKLQGKERNLKILNMTYEGIEFMLDNTYHFAKYLENTTSKMTLVVDGVKITFDKHSEFDKIVYKNSGVESDVDSQISLKSQIPGRVVSINVAVGNNVKKGDVICVLESMKMQISIKSHKDGVIKTMKIKQGNSVAKNDVLVEIE